MGGETVLRQEGLQLGTVQRRTFQKVVKIFRCTGSAKVGFKQRASRDGWLGQQFLLWGIQFA